MCRTTSGELEVTKISVVNEQLEVSADLFTVTTSQICFSLKIKSSSLFLKVSVILILCPANSTTHHSDNIMSVHIAPDLNFCVDNSMSSDKQKALYFVISI